MYYFIQNGLIKIKLSDSKEFILKKNYAFSIEELTFFKQPNAILDVVEDVTLIGVSMDSLDQMEVKRSDWLFKNLTLWALTQDPVFRILNRQSIIKFSQEFEFLKMRINKSTQNILYTDDQDLIASIGK